MAGPVIYSNLPNELCAEKNNANFISLVRTQPPPPAPPAPDHGLIVRQIRFCSLVLIIRRRVLFMAGLCVCVANLRASADSTEL